MKYIDYQYISKQRKKIENKKNKREEKEDILYTSEETFVGALE